MKIVLSSKKIFFMIFIQFFLSTTLFSFSSLKIYYFERPPYYYTDKNGAPTGLLIDITSKICRNADINFSFVKLPVKRVILYLQQPVLACSPGWYFTKKRAKHFKYTLPIYESKPIVAVVNSGKWGKRRNMVSLYALFSLNMELGLISGFKYSELLERFFRKHSEYIKKYTMPVDKLLKLILTGRVDYTFLSYENASFLLKREKNFENKLKIINITDIKKGRKRYLLCSKAVPENIIKKLDNAIKRIKKK